MEAYINSIESYLPEKVLTNEELTALFPEWPAEQISQKVGIEKRHVAADGETASDMAVQAAERLFSQQGAIKKEDIDFILFCTSSPDYKLPTSACLIQDRLGIPTSAGALDINLGCSGYVYSLALAKSLVVSGIARNVLLLTGETYTKYLHPNDKGTRTIFGDGATATIVSTEGFARIGEFVLGTDGQGADDLIVKAGGARLPRSDCDADNYLYMSGGNIFAFSLKTVPGLVRAVLDKNHTTSEDVKLYILHQANKLMLDSLRRKMQIPEEKFFVNYRVVGNTVSNALPLALQQAVGRDRLKAGSIALLAGWGVGLSWGATELFF